MQEAACIVMLLIWATVVGYRVRNLGSSLWVQPHGLGLMVQILDSGSGLDTVGGVMVMCVVLTAMDSGSRF